MPNFGAYLNRPERGFPLVGKCRACDDPDCLTTVYEHALVWDCGYFIALPLMRKRCGRKGCEVCRA